MWGYWELGKFEVSGAVLRTQGREVQGGLGKEKSENKLNGERKSHLNPRKDREPGRLETGRQSLASGATGRHRRLRRQSSEGSELGPGQRQSVSDTSE